MSGYDIIKKCEEILGYKPSAGSIYPLLKTMEKHGLIRSREEKRRKVYFISTKGKEFIEGLFKIKEEFYRKLQSHIIATAEIFDDKELKCFGKSIFEEYPLLRKIIFAIKKMDKEKAEKILEKIYKEIEAENESY